MSQAPITAPRSKMSRRKAKEDDYYDQPYHPSQECDPEDSDLEEPECNPPDLKKHFDRLRKKKVPQPAAKTHTGAKKKATTSRLKSSPQIKEATKQTVGSTLPQPSNVRRCKNSEICLQARARSEEAKAPVICHCYTKIPTTPVSFDRVGKPSRNVEAWLGLENILPAKTRPFKTLLKSFVQLVCDAVFHLVFWSAVFYGIILLLRHFGYNIHVPSLSTWATTK